jgi:hypothetical protein
MKTVKEVDAGYLFRLLGAIVAHYEEHKEYPKTLYLRRDEYEWAREKLNVSHSLVLGQVVIKIYPDDNMP